MERSHPLEVSMGMEFYSTDISGTGGRIKKQYEGFIVEEITPTQETLSIRPWKEDTDYAVDGDRRKHIHFTVQKMGLTTMDVATILAAELKIPHHLVNYAGLKDKRAVTAQRMSVPSGALRYFDEMRLTNIMIGDLQYARKSLQIGELWGNRFTIRLEDMDVTCQDALDSARTLGEHHLLNYFGVQRFGITRPSNFLVGKSLVMRDYEEAARAMLALTNEYESDELTEARQKLQDELHPTEKILDAFPQDMRHERVVIKYLISNPGEYEHAFARIEPRIQTFFIHSYQSFLFNRLLSKRVESSIPIDRPNPGDFLIQLDEPHAGRDSWQLVTERNLDESEQLVSAEEFGVACPVPGYSTKIPPSKQTEMLMDVLKEEGVALSAFRFPKSRAQNSPGGLHLASIRAKELTIECDAESLVLRFKLRKGSYATIVLREIMRNHPLSRV